MISICINVDSRKGFIEEATTADTMLNGCRSTDFFIDGVYNKRAFFDGYEYEVILYVDYHEKLPEHIEYKLNKMVTDKEINTLIINHHRKYYDNYIYYPKANCMNYLHCLSMAHGDYVVHFDGDMCAFINDKNVIREWMQQLDDGKYKFISNPSLHSPFPDGDTDRDYLWASTRFFITKQEHLDYTEIIKCLKDSNYLYGKYGEKKSRNPWFEHIIGIIAGSGFVYYPPIEYDRYMIWSWNKYISGLTRRLQEMPYDKVKEYIQARGGISYPCDVGA